MKDFVPILNKKNDRLIRDRSSIPESFTPGEVSKSFSENISPLKKIRNNL